MRQRQERQKPQQREREREPVREQEPELLFCHKRPEQQPAGLPTTEIFSF
jgi:hypothetical protein